MSSYYADTHMELSLLAGDYGIQLKNMGMGITDGTKKLESKLDLLAADLSFDNSRPMGIRADMTNFTIDIDVQQANDIPPIKILAKNQIDSYTTQAWFSQDK
uniref:Uncharacterized protein n=1 Tax=Tanacetum cinerariifolium TaxID=118510 RepID=A0A6L2L739_TANCI|nr:hypothetical protein [Tanacetum cinerariifolium]